MRSFRFALFCAALYGTLTGLLPAQASRRPGASRALRFDWPAQSVGTSQVPTSATRVALRADTKNGLTLIFTREDGGTRNLWQATPGDITDWTRIATESPAWQTAPLTTLAAPQWADKPILDRAGRLFCITNASGNAGSDFSQIARFDPDTRQFIPLTNERARHRELALSPDGTRLAFVREIGGIETIYIMSSAGGAARRVLDGARHPAWLDDNTLLLSGARSGFDGLFRVTLPPDGAKLRPNALHPTLLFPRSGEVGVAPDGGQLCLAPDDKENSGDARLILLASDGSNARAIAGTEGARAPRYAPGGETLLFDAPVGAMRSLWMMPLLKTAPTVQILAARALPIAVSSNAAPAIEIIGTVFAPEIATPQVRLEVGRGNEPTQWQTLTPPRPPVQRERLGLWTPPPGALGEWTLRLSAQGAEGESAQTTLTVTLPLSPDAGNNVFEPSVTSQTSIKLTPPGFGGLHTAPPRTTIGQEDTKIRTLPSGVKVFSDAARLIPGNSLPANNVLPPVKPPVSVPTPQALVANPPSKAPGKGALPFPAPLAGTLPSSPLPPLPPAPGTRPDILGGEPVRFDSAPSEPALPDAPPSPRKPQAPPVTAFPPVRSSAPEPRVIEKSVPRETIANATSGGKTGVPISVSGMPAMMSVGESVPISVSLRNIGAQSWETSGAAPVRLIILWHDVKSGMRTQYRIEWLRANVPPGGGALLNVSLKAPSRAGRFRVTFAVMRLPGGQYQPPSATASNDSSNAEELAQTTFSITVQ